MTADDRSTRARSTRELMEAGEFYVADDPELGEMSSRAQELMAAYNATSAARLPTAGSQP